ncbi:MAG: glycosyltransferase family 4 protein [Chitinophagaceae bacterium]|nr:glycosyltransferase family 4 protein [Chitinophagaceae bacterium]
MYKKIIFLNSHPIQYFAPLYQEIARCKELDLAVLYCSDETLKGAIDKQFGVKVKWDIPLLNGYSYKFLKNKSWKPSIFKGFWGLINWEVITFLKKKEQSIIIVHGWGYFTHVITIIAAKLLGHTVCIRAETPLNQEFKKNKLVTFLKHFYLKGLFLFVDYFLYVGKQNKMFYQHLNIADKKLINAPYCVDNQRFQSIHKSISKEQAKGQLNLPLNKKIILFSGKYIQKKRPLDLLQAFKELHLDNVLLVFVGDGNLKTAMEQFIAEHAIQDKVILTGFVNQSLIPFYYASSDVFVMCSGLGETWGLSVNEAMNFGLPVIVSNTCGSSHDLIQENENGFTFNEGDIIALRNHLKYILQAEQSEYNKMCDKSLSIIKNYSYNQIIEALKKIAA